MRRHIIACILTTLLLPLVLCGGCQEQQTRSANGRLNVVTTLFPLYDFVRAVGGNRVTPTLLLPPGVEPHHFEPKPSDMVKVSRADLFIFTNKQMEPWAVDLAKGLDSPSVLVVDAGTGARLLPALDQTEAQHDQHMLHAGFDPHIWLDFDNARLMVHNICNALVAKDPANRDYYQNNAAAYEQKLRALDRSFRETLATCRHRILLHGGHYAFGYLAHRYGLRYLAAFPANMDAEPTPSRLAELIGQMRQEGLRHLFSEELVSPRVVETIARESGASVLRLHGAHNITRDELTSGATFISLMEQNLQQLKVGLQCH